ncbi:MAG: transcriptional regulator GlxA family with amidase domain [Halieaceae bacterium]|jgi:transcriptional regulator GlxA family with amidase domain
MPSAAALIYPEALATSFTLPAEILRAADQLARSQRWKGARSSMRLLGLQDTGNIRLESGLEIGLDGSLSELLDVDLLILPAIWRHPRRTLARCRDHLPTLIELHRRGGIICSVGSASNLLAEAGLLDDRPGTTHWHDFERFAAAHPRVNLKQRHLITQSDRLYCVGSVNSIADFMVHIVEQWFGERIARAVERQFSPEARQSFESAAFLQWSPGAHHDALIREAQDHMQRHFADPCSVDLLAGLAGLSARSFARRFREATGDTPMHYLQSLRLAEARALLQHSDLAVADVAWRCGFASPSRFAQGFRQSTGQTPSGYRRAVRGKRFGDTQAKPRESDAAHSA